MRQRTSPKTLQQQQRKGETGAPIVVGFAVSSVLFSGALLFCGALLVVVGIALLHCSNGKAKQQRLSLASVVHRLLALRRSALDYSLTLSIAPRDERCQTQSKVPRIAAAAPLTVVSQKVETATMASKPENLQLGQKNETTALASSASIATRDVLPRIRRLKEQHRKQKAKQDNVTSSALTTSVKAVHVRTGSKKMQPVKAKGFAMAPKAVQEIGPDQELAETVFSPEEVSPSSQPTVPTHVGVAVYHWYDGTELFADIELDPISKPARLASLSSQRFKSEGNAELRLMLDELDAIRLELDPAMARCTSLLDGGKEAKELH
ncbi:unnamed protein product [Hyaloperonospora brassicae]|uniref:Transmembrane protein n=1 Tax=Hyaloperonospora brassicae TaxID=162125 RepID=A0AAV0U2Y9_HYABA|nr:unnamed protein product [Hyaloperonospora brassicae]